MKTIIVMIPYFGKLPPFFEAWRETALRNDTIDFLLFTDDTSVTSRGNVRVEHMSWETFAAEIQSVFPFQVALRAPYKLCDFKPALGDIFHRFIRGYDFWGYGDIDLLLGDLRGFLTEELLERYDRFFYYGHISLYKNNEKMNSLYRFHEERYPAVNHQECFSSRRAFYFDEFGGMYAKCLINGVQVYDDANLRRDPIIGQGKFYWENTNEENQFIILWEDGKLYAVHKKQRVEIIYAHFFRRKFAAEEKPDTVQRIVVAPNKLRYNTVVTEKDFELSEPGDYRKTYFKTALKGTLKRNGILGTLEKRKRDRDYWPYRRELEKKYGNKPV